RRNKTGGRLSGQLTQLMNVQFTRVAILYGDGQDFWFKPCTIAYFAWFVRHERSNAIASEFALSLLVQPLHLRHQSLERFCNFRFTIVAEIHFDRRPIRAEVERLL